MLSGTGLVLLFSYIPEQRRTEARNLCLSFVFWGLSFISMYFISLRMAGSNTILQKYWTAHFMPLPFRSPADQFWFPTALLNLLYNPGAIDEILFGAAAFILGIYHIAVKRGQKFYLFLLMPLIMTLTASGLHKYPVDGRLLLFYVPALYVFIAEGLTFLLNKRSHFPRILGTALLIAILWAPVKTAYTQGFSHRTFYSEDIKPVLQYVTTNAKKNDAIYIYYGASRAFLFYAKSYGFDKKDYIIGVTSRDDWKKYTEDLNQLKGKGRTWVIFTHVYSVNGKSEKDYILDYLDTIGAGTLGVVSTYASAYLFKDL